MNNLTFGYEAGRIAQALVNGEGYASPFLVSTGPTAWLGPVYPLIVAGAFKLFGVYTPASATAILVLNSIFAALTSALIVAVGRETFGLRAGAVAAWTFALLPYEVRWATRWVWDTSLSAFLLTLAFWATLRLTRQERAVAWGMYGALWGAIAMTNPSLLSFLPVAVGWLWYHSQHRRQRMRFLVAAAVCAAVISPWAIRNYLVMGKLIPLRSNFAMELWVANHEGANGLIMFWSHPVWSPVEMNRYRQLGEVAYLEEKGRDARKWIFDHPSAFASITAKRVMLFWAGIPSLERVGPRMGVGSRHAIYLASSLLALAGVYFAVRTRTRGAGLFSGLVILYPLVYYVTHNHPRYRAPIEPLMILLVVALVVAAIVEHRQKRKASPEEGPGLLT